MKTETAAVRKAIVWRLAVYGILVLAPLALTAATGGFADQGS